MDRILPPVGAAAVTRRLKDGTNITTMIQVPPGPEGREERMSLARLIFGPVNGAGSPRPAEKQQVSTAFPSLADLIAQCRFMSSDFRAHCLIDCLINRTSR